MSEKADKSESINEKKKKRFKEDLKQIIQFLDKHNVECWIDHGTLLGITRDSDFISWDDDMDFGCLLSEGVKIYDLESELKSLNWKMFVKHNMITITNGSTFIDFFFYIIDKDVIINEYIAFKNHPTLVLDSILARFHLYFFTYKFEKRLSSCQKQKIEKISYSVPPSFRRYLKSSVDNFWTALIKRKRETVIPKKYVFPLKKINFKGFLIPVPKHPEKHLESYYGKDWATPIMYNRFKK